MNTRDEIIEALKGNRGDTAPPAIFTQTGTVPQMDNCGCCWPEANFDAAKMAELSLQPSRMFGFATAKVPFCITVETERFGAELNPGEKSAQPSVAGSPFFSEVEVPDVPDLMSPDEFVSGGRCAVVCEAAAKVRKEHPELFTIAGCIDPFSVSYLLTGVDNFLMGLLMDPDRCDAWVSAVTPHLTEYVKVLSENADDVQIIAESSSEIMPPENFEQFVAVPVRKMISAAKGFTTIHSCGETSEVLEEVASLGEDGLSVESFDRAGEICERVSGKVRLIGGIPPVSMLMQGKPEDIVANAKKYSDLGYALIAPECGVPPMTPNANLQALAHYREL
jgi:[methyl-Co(III) methanol-specific corrinoid protein]:coenzyme M methyltransferase